MVRLQALSKNSDTVFTGPVTGQFGRTLSICESTRLDDLQILPRCFLNLCQAANPRVFWVLLLSVRIVRCGQLRVKSECKSNLEATCWNKRIQSSLQPADGAQKTIFRIPNTTYRIGPFLCEPASKAILFMNMRLLSCRRNWASCNVTPIS